jgi:hypothetical protein
MKIGDYIVCKSIPTDSKNEFFTVGGVYKIREIIDNSKSYHKTYIIFTDDNYPYFIIKKTLEDNFELLRNKNLDILLK